MRRYAAIWELQRKSARNRKARFQIDVATVVFPRPSGYEPGRAVLLDYVGRDLERFCGIALGGIGWDT